MAISTVCLKFLSTLDTKRSVDFVETWFQLLFTTNFKVLTLKLYSLNDLIKSWKVFPYD